MPIKPSLAFSFFGTNSSLAGPTNWDSGINPWTSSAWTTAPPLLDPIITPSTGLSSSLAFSRTLQPLSPLALSTERIVAPSSSSGLITNATTSEPDSKLSKSSFE